MTKNLETKTLNGELIKKGYEAFAAIRTPELPKELTEIMIYLAEKRFNNIKIIPGK